MSLEPVICPECHFEVRVELLHYGFIPILEKCPACGAGPVALLERMVDSLEGDAQTGRAGGVVAGDGGDPLFMTPSDDHAMNAAIARARASIDQFINRLMNPQPGDHTFGVKWRFVDDENGEYMWVNDVHVEASDFVGILTSQPQVVKNVWVSQTIRLPIAEIVDWGFSNGERIFGNYTLRAMLPSLPAALRDELLPRLVGPGEL